MIAFVMTTAAAPSPNKILLSFCPQFNPTEEISEEIITTFLYLPHSIAYEIVSSAVMKLKHVELISKHGIPECCNPSCS